MEVPSWPPCLPAFLQGPRTFNAWLISLVWYLFAAVSLREESWCGKPHVSIQPRISPLEMGSGSGSEAEAQTAKEDKESLHYGKPVYGCFHTEVNDTVCECEFKMAPPTMSDSSGCHTSEAWRRGHRSLCWAYSTHRVGADKWGWANVLWKDMQQYST